MSESMDGVEGRPSTLVHGSTTAGELIEIQQAHPERYFAAMNAVQHNTQRRIIWAVVQNNGRVSYKDLDEYMTVSDRTRRKHVTTLEENDLINRIDANFTFIEFESVESEALIKNALTSWYNIQ